MSNLIVNSSWLDNTYINIKNNPTKISQKNRGIIYGGKDIFRRIRCSENRKKYI